ncbi:MAG: redox-sensing transcriptional repressor Rex [Planctomycetota bacterium]|nr:redox-sensing transcriptional repressor Rex [Planctomycetota bacterium]
MSIRQQIPGPTIKRLTLYLREVERRQSHGETRISSRELGRALGLTDTQIRKDLSWFGQFGQAGVGYLLEPMAARLREILGKDRAWQTAVVGAGRLGQAIMSYGPFAREGFEIAAVFDADPALVGREVGGHRIHGMEDLDSVVKEQEILLGILSVPREAAQEVAERLIEAGVLGLLNFAPVRLEVGDRASVASVDFSSRLERLAFQVSAGLKGSIDGED